MSLTVKILISIGALVFWNFISWLYLYKITRTNFSNKTKKIMTIAANIILLAFLIFVMILASQD